MSSVPLVSTAAVGRFDGVAGTLVFERLVGDAQACWSDSRIAIGSAAHSADGFERCPRD